MKPDKKLIDDISPTFCSAVWVQSTIYLHNGMTHSCCYLPVHPINVDELKSNPSALHNSKFKKLTRRLMKEGVRPKGCGYCWVVEDSKSGELSERYRRSLNEEWSVPYLSEMATKNTSENFNPTNLEVSFSNICNLRCAYCSPVFSSSWEQEIKKYGPYPDYHSTGDLERIYEAGLIKTFEHNPYTEAFWKWWPELKKSLHFFRITGGEPLLEKNSWVIMDNLIAEPQENLTLCFNSNLAVPERVIDDFLRKVKLLQGKCKGVFITTSCDSSGKQAEYIRYGLNYDSLIGNINRLLESAPNVVISVTVTLNILGLSSLDQFLITLLKLRERYPDRLAFYFSYLRNPSYLSFEIAPSSIKRKWLEKLENFLTASQDKLTREELSGLRLLIYKLKNPDASYLADKNARTDFAKFIKEYDKRKGTDFCGVFPELEAFYRSYDQD